MKKYLSITISFLIGLSLAAQPGDDILRSLADPDLQPFYHGVASGDPTSSSVILWTRVTPEIDDAVSVSWKVSTDTIFSDTVQQGVEITNANQDYTVKIDVEGLDSGTYYYYEFTALGKNSVIGRTKTAPDNDADQLRFGVVSCSSYETGYFNVYRKLYERNDMDAILHLGDYIYEYGSNSSLSGPRAHMPDHEIIDLADYRMRHAQHKLDKDAQKMHQNFAVIATWDDHESANNSWRDGSNNHSEGSEGTWSDRKSASIQAYYEWMPIRRPDENNFNRIFRKVSYGDLADIFMMDTRLYDRDEQAEFPPQYDDEDRTIIGEEQMAWLQDGMLNSEAKWKILGQQVMMGQLVIPNYLFESFTPLNNDQWDGYSADRTRLFDFILDNELENTVVLTGDIHTSWAMDLPYSIFDYNKFTGEGSVGVEFVTTAVTSTSSPIALPPIYGLIRAALPYIKYVDLSRKGYTILDLKNEQAQADYYTINTIVQPTSYEFFQQGWYTEDGTQHLNRAEGATEDGRPEEPVAPCFPRAIADTVITAVINNSFDVLGVYPNPFGQLLVLEVHLFEDSDVKVTIIDTKASELMTRDFGRLPRGRNMLTFDDIQLPAGLYEVILQAGDQLVRRSVVKVE